jgi:hypothetical protein
MRFTLRLCRPLLLDILAAGLFTAMTPTVPTKGPGDHNSPPHSWLFTAGTCLKISRAVNLLIVLTGDGPLSTWLRRSIFASMA